MNEWISVKRQSRGVLITVTQRVENNTVSAGERLLGPTKEGIKAAVQRSRAQAEMYLEGIDAAGVTE